LPSNFNELLWRRQDGIVLFRIFDRLTDILRHKHFCIVVLSRVELKFPGGLPFVQRIVGIFVVVLYEDYLDFPRRLIVIIVLPNRFEDIADSLSDVQSVWYRVWSCDKIFLDINHEKCPAPKYGV
jgi:hypothetical protein